MKYRIFYSWQMDAPDDCNRKFIRGTIEAAFAGMGEGETIVDSPRVDSGMEGISGTPEVASIMFRKIDDCDIFIGDVTLVGRIAPIEAGKEDKKVPNPNVLLEMGYAAGRLGWERVICVMNEHNKFGSRYELPFDIRNRRFPIDYILAPDVTNPTKTSAGQKASKDLTKWIRKAIKTAAETEHEGVNVAISRLDIDCLKVYGAYGLVPSFPDLEEDDLRREALKDTLRVAEFRASVLRLLDLGLIQTDVQLPQYAYHWTPRGRLSVVELARRHNIQINADAAAQGQGGESAVSAEEGAQW